MDQTFKVFQNGPKKVARPASERSEPSRGERAWKEGWGGKMRAGGGRKRKSSAVQRREEGSLPCLLCSLTQKSFLPPFPSLRFPFLRPSFFHLHCYDGKFMGSISMAGIFLEQRNGRREGIAFVSTPFSASLQAAPSVRRSMKMGKNAPKRRAILPVRPTSDMSFWTRCQPAI